MIFLLAQYIKQSYFFVITCQNETQTAGFHDFWAEDSTFQMLLIQHNNTGGKWILLMFISEATWIKVKATEVIS
jgi:hypothetical protein